MEKAIQDDDVETVVELLDAGKDINSQAKTPKGRYPLLAYAVDQGADRVIKKLLERRVNPNTEMVDESNKKQTVLQYAIRGGDISIVYMLLDAGANPNVTGMDKPPPLFMAIFDPDIEIVDLLLDKGADPNLLYMETNNTPLVSAIRSNQTNIVESLLNKGADPNKKVGYQQEPPIVLASNYANDIEILKLLLDKGADINAIDRLGGDALVFAIFKGKLDFVKLLLEKGVNIDDYDESLLVEAARSKNLEIFKLLLDHGASPSKETARQNAVTEVAKNNDISFLKALIEKGVDVNMQTKDEKETAIMWASLRNKIDAAKLLMEHGADPKLKTIHGKDALSVAKTDEMRDILLKRAPAPPPSAVPYSGKSKSDIEFFNMFLGKVDEGTTEAQMKNMIRNATFCPVCLSNTVRTDGCLYMKHICPEITRHSELYKKYKNESGEIWWCVDCCRICSGHRHYKIGLAIDGKPELQPDGFAFAKSCDSSDPDDIAKRNATNGGGSTTEKLKRIARMIDYAFELQHFVGEISEQEARTELIEEVWNAATMRLRFDPLKFKRWKTDLSVFTDMKPDVSAIPEAVPAAGDIEDPVIEKGNDPYALEDDIIVIQFKHKNKDGVMFDHVHGDEKRFIGKKQLLTFLSTMGEKLGKCFDDDCGGWLWPQEIEKAFADPRLEATDEDRKVLAAYKERFNAAKAPKTGGARWKFNFVNEMDNGQCYLPKKKAGNRTRKSKKIAKKTRRNK